MFAERFRLDGTLQGLRVLELGAGTGVPSLTASALGAKVTASDKATTALALINAAADFQQQQQQGKGPLATTNIDLLDTKGQPLPADCDILVVTDLLFNHRLAVGVAERCIEAYRNGVGFMVASPPKRVGEKPFLDRLDIAGIRHSGFREVPLPECAKDIWPEVCGF